MQLLSLDGKWTLTFAVTPPHPKVILTVTFITPGRPPGAFEGVVPAPPHCMSVTTSLLLPSQTWPIPVLQCIRGGQKVVSHVGRHSVCFK